MANELLYNIQTPRANQVKYVTRQEYETLVEHKDTTPGFVDTYFVVNDAAINDDTGANLKPLATVKMYLGEVPFSDIIFVKNKDMLLQIQPESVAGKLLICEETKIAAVEKNVFAELYAEQISSIVYSTADDGGEYWESFASIGQGGEVVDDSEQLLEIPASSFTGGLLEKQNVSTSNMGNFVWGLQFKLPHLSETNFGTTGTSFLFHINDNSDVTSFNSRTNVFALTLKSDETLGHFIDIEAPTTTPQGAPNTVDKGNIGTIKLPEGCDPKNWVDVLVRVVDTELVIQVSQGTLTNSSTITIPEQCITLAPKGDFGVMTTDEVCYIQNVRIYQIPINTSNSILYLEPKMYISNGSEYIPLTPTDANIDLHLENMVDVNSANGKSIGDVLRWSGSEWVPDRCNPVWERPI